MALDQALFEAYARGESPPVLRIYTWRPSAVSLGRFQDVDSSVDLEACRRLGIDLVRRPTGGRAILHTEEEVTFSMVVSRDRLGTTGVMDSYRKLAGGIITALRLLGLDARLVGRSAPSSARRPGQDPACFSVKARCDLAVGSAKVVGSAQVERDGFVLQQNSLPLRIGLAAWRAVFRRPSEAPAAAGIWELAGAELTYDQVAVALKTGFEEEFGVQLAPCQVSMAEAARATQLTYDSMAPVASTGPR
jgi:lipoate-protein ligase A